jgi:hypothetical protein
MSAHPWPGLLSASFGLDFLCDIAFRTNKHIRGSLAEWPTVFGNLFAHIPEARVLFVSRLNTRPELVSQLLLECSNSEVRHCFAEICREFFLNLYRFEAAEQAKATSHQLLSERFVPLIAKVVCCMSLCLCLLRVLCRRPLATGNTSRSTSRCLRIMQHSASFSVLICCP